MKTNSVVIKYLKKVGYNPNTSYYSYIQFWKEWYENNVPKFHEYHDQTGTKRTLHKMGMAKRICEDWASILYTERDNIVCQNENNQKFIDEKFKKLKFNDILPTNIENAFWSGTVATIIRIKNAIITKNNIIANEKTEVELINMTANQIIPLLTDNGKIKSVSFVSETYIDGNILYYIEIHELVNNRYNIRNIYVNENGEEVEINGVVKEYTINTNIPLYSLLSPRKVCNIEGNNGLGVSIYANAIDQLQFTDTVFNNFFMDYYLGGKKVFYNKKLMRYTTKTYRDETTGEQAIEEIPIYPDDVTKQQFQVIGDEMDNINETPAIVEHNPDLREADNEKGINMSLNMLSFMCDMGKGYYKFDSGSILTATEAIINNRDLVGNAKKHRNAVNEYVIGIVKALLYLGRTLFKKDVNEDDEISIVDKDGFLQSEEQVKENYMKEMNMGLRSKIGYLMKFDGLTEEQAKKEISLVDDENKLSVNIENLGE